MQAPAPADSPRRLDALLAATAPAFAGPAAAGVEERVRRDLARELHDQVVQELTTTLIDLENFKRRPFDEEAVTEQVDLVQGSLRRTLDELREMLYRLRDEEPWEAGFAGSIRDFALRYGRRTGVRVVVTVSGDWPAEIRAAAARHLQRLIHEAVNNARLHGRAGLVRVHLCGSVAGRARVTIRDDGRGIDPETPAGMGILGMRERALLLGATLSVQPAAGRGTVILLELPRSALV